MQFAHLRGTNILVKFYDDWAKNVTSKNCHPPGSHVIQLTGTIFELNSNIKKQIVFTCFYYIHVEKNAPPTGGTIFSPIWTIFELVQDINKTNVLTNFHDWAKIVTSRETNVLTKFHENWAKNVTSRVFTCFHYIHIEKNAPPTGGNVFSPMWTIFELCLQSFSIAKKGKLPTPGRHVIQLTGTIFELNSHIKETNVLTKFHENWTKNVTSRVFTCFHYKHIEKNAPPTGAHVFSPIWTIFELLRAINKTNVLTNFHDDWAKLVTSRVLTKKTAPPTGGRVFQLLTYFELNRDFIGTKLLTKFHETGQ
ncbi:hypothetical protein DPMN_037460 [Dreissena polymorpha]|uniref:Uncharacterized protein n=1 Tax=Dreissena polymorpha TaxID=45954 RepID=A0A9D4MCQ4_DREPO|nr:hypothetical protein DPMN_037460 [Dreissena polymorpha]